MLLPIGSFVYLKQGQAKIMIIMRGAVVPENEEEHLYTYGGCLYPNGLDPKKVIYFNDEDIDKVIVKGFSDDEEERYAQLYSEWVEENGSKYAKKSDSNNSNSGLFANVDKSK